MRLQVRRMHRHQGSLANNNDLGSSVFGFKTWFLCLLAGVQIEVAAASVEQVAVLILLLPDVYQVLPIFLRTVDRVSTASIEYIILETLPIKSILEPVKLVQSSLH